MPPGRCSQQIQAHPVRLPVFSFHLGPGELCTDEAFVTVSPHSPLLHTPLCQFGLVIKQKTSGCLPLTVPPLPTCTQMTSACSSGSCGPYGKVPGSRLALIFTILSMFLNHLPRNTRILCFYLEFYLLKISLTVKKSNRMSLLKCVCNQYTFVLSFRDLRGARIKTEPINEFIQ